MQVLGEFRLPPNEPLVEVLDAARQSAREYLLQVLWQCRGGRIQHRPCIFRGLRRTRRGSYFSSSLQGGAQVPPIQGPFSAGSHACCQDRVRFVPCMDIGPPMHGPPTVSVMATRTTGAACFFLRKIAPPARRGGCSTKMKQDITIPVPVLEESRLRKVATLTNLAEHSDTKVGKRSDSRNVNQTLLTSLPFLSCICPRLLCYNNFTFFHYRSFREQRERILPGEPSARYGQSSDVHFVCGICCKSAGEASESQCQWQAYSSHIFQAQSFTTATMPPVLCCSGARASSRCLYQFHEYRSLTFSTSLCCRCRHWRPPLLPSGAVGKASCRGGCGGHPGQRI